MKRLIPLARPRGSMVWAMSLAAACGLMAVPASAAPDKPSAAFVYPAGTPASAANCRVGLPDGLKATVTPDGARLDPRSADGQTMISYRTDGHQYIVPTDVAGQGATRSLAAYDVTALAQRACGIGEFAPVTRQKEPPGHAYTLGRLTAHLIDSEGQPSRGATLYLVNADHTSYADKAIAIRNGILRISVPTGQYAAILVDHDHITVEPELTVTDETSVTLDSRTSTHQIPVPTTPRPATLSSTDLAIYRSDDTPDSLSAEPVVHVFNTTGALSKVTLNSAPRVKHGKFTVVATADLASPTGAPEPYAYHIANSYDHLPSSYPTSVDASSLTTVKRTYSAPAGTGVTDLLVENVTPVWAATAGEVTATGVDFVAAGTVRDEYVSSSADLNWRANLEDERTGTVLADTDSVYRPGSRLSETFYSGVPHPGVQIDTGTGAVNCGACASKDVMSFAIGTSSDSSPGSFGSSIRDVNDISLTRDGELLAAGEGSLFGAAVHVPTGPATYQLKQKTVRDSVLVAPSTDTTWTFKAEPGKGKTAPSHCVGTGDPCAALPLLFASLDTDADIQHRLAAGRHTIDLDVTHQQYAAAPAVSGAELEVSYDSGKTWHNPQVKGSNGDFRAEVDVPADATGSTVSFKLSAWDKQGNRIDQVLPDAYRVR